MVSSSVKVLAAGGLKVGYFAVALRALRSRVSAPFFGKRLRSALLLIGIF
jgi:hypothetical protein